MIALAAVVSGGAWWRFGRAAALGFLLRMRHRLPQLPLAEERRLRTRGPGHRIRGKPQSGKGIVARFLLRYVLLGAAAYAILTSFPASLSGLFAGLFLPVGAIACEAVYELYVAVARGA